MLAACGQRRSRKLPRSAVTMRVSASMSAASQDANLPKQSRRCSSMAEHQLPKLNTRVRFPSSAPRCRVAFPPWSQRFPGVSPPQVLRASGRFNTSVVPQTCHSVTICGLVDAHPPSGTARTRHVRRHRSSHAGRSTPRACRRGPSAPSDPSSTSSPLTPRCFRRAEGRGSGDRSTPCRRRPLSSSHAD